MIEQLFPDTPYTTIKKVINDLRKEGVIEKYGKGKKELLAEDIIDIINFNL